MKVRENDMTRLIINGDDFGMSEGVSLGIVKCYKEGILRSTTMMANQESAPFAASIMKDYPGLAVGLHLTLTVGKPVLNDLKNIVDENGNFFKQGILKEMEVDVEEVRREYQAQMDLFIKLTGQVPSHIDHHHQQDFFPEQRDLMKELGEKYNIPVRGSYVRYPGQSEYEDVKFSGAFYNKTATVDFFLEDQGHILEEDIIEFMSHPGFVDQELTQKSGYVMGRTNEMAVLTHPQVMQWIKENHIELISYRDVKKRV